MFKVDYTEILGGALLVATGIGVTAVSLSSYSVGTLRRMGPGMFPSILGVILALLGVLIVIGGLRKQGHRPDIRIFSPIFVLGGVAAFAALVGPFGLIPAILGVTIISSLAELRIRPASLAMLCIALCLIAPIVFIYGLGLQISLARWPF